MSELAFRLDIEGQAARHFEEQTEVASFMQHIALTALAREAETAGNPAPLTPNALKLSPYLTETGTSYILESSVDTDDARLQVHQLPIAMERRGSGNYATESICNSDTGEILIDDISHYGRKFYIINFIYRAAMLGKSQDP